MDIARHTATAARPPTHGRPAQGARARLHAAFGRSALRYAGLPIAVAVSAVLNTVRLAQNGYANIFYSAAVKSMLHSLHDFVFVSFDPGSLISVDKPPLGVWVQVLSAKLFGFSPLSLLLPEAIAGVLAVALLYVLLVRRMGAPAAFAGALALAVFPSFVAVSRDNGVDPLLLLLLLLACGAALRASETGSWRSLLASAVLVGLAFNTKTLAAYLVLPGIALAYLVCAPLSLPQRILRLVAAGAVMIVISFAWIAFVELTPASQRPYVGSSTNNSELGLTFEYNGFGRVEGQLGGPGTEKVLPGAFVPLAQIRRANQVVRSQAPPRAPAPKRNGSRLRTNTGVERAPGASHASSGRERNPIPFGGPPGPLRLFGKGLGDQGGWLLPFALFGLLALFALVALEAAVAEHPAAADEPGTRSADAASGPSGSSPPRASSPSTASTASTGSMAQTAPPAPSASSAAGGLRARRARWTRNPRVATLLVLGGWFAVEAVVLSTSKGIVHPYYVSGLAPGTGAMVGAGFAALAALARGRYRLLGIALALGAVVATVAAELVLMHKVHYMVWFAPALIAGCAVALIALLAARRLAPLALALALALTLVVPAAYASSTWLAPVEGTFPAAGPKRDAGTGGYGVDGGDLAIDRALARYVHAHGPGSRWALLTVASDEAAPMILMGLDAGALAGYSGTDPALDGAGLARLVRRGEARYVLLGGDYSLRGGNGATKAVLGACRQLPASTWQSPVAFPYGLVLFDCAGDEAALASGTH